jgi:hypothetical protein
MMGANGERGATGESGPPGLHGVQGLQGPHGAQGIPGVPGATGETGATGTQGSQGLQGLQGIQGVTGTDGFSPTVTVSEDTQRSYVLEVTNRDGSFLTPNLSPLADTSVYSANLAGAGSSMNVPVGNLIYTVSNYNAGASQVQLRAAAGTVPADVKKFSQFDTTQVDSSSWDNAAFTETPTVIDTMVYGRSNEFHVTRIRQQDPSTGLWSLYEVNLFSSASDARVNVWVKRIATGLTM